MSEYMLVPVETIRRAIVSLERFANDALAGRNSAYELRELLAAAPAVQGEPVGEVRLELGAPSIVYGKLYSEAAPTLVPGTLLYTAPQPTEHQQSTLDCDECGAESVRYVRADIAKVRDITENQ